MVQADFVLSVLAGTAGVATLYRGAVHRPRPAPPAAGPVVAPSEEVRRHAAREAGTAPWRLTGEGVAPRWGHPLRGADAGPGTGGCPCRLSVAAPVGCGPDAG